MMYLQCLFEARDIQKLIPMSDIFSFKSKRVPNSNLSPTVFLSGPLYLSENIGSFSNDYDSFHLPVGGPVSEWIKSFFGLCTIKADFMHTASKNLNKKVRSGQKKYNPHIIR